jgi:hypothetical protein
MMKNSLKRIEVSLPITTIWSLSAVYGVVQVLKGVNVEP